MNDRGTKDLKLLKRIKDTEDTVNIGVLEEREWGRVILEEKKWLKTFQINEGDFKKFYLSHKEENLKINTHQRTLHQ